MQISVRPSVLTGQAFGARGCSSCSCNPCDCNPCTCGDSLAPSYPDWRVSGYYINQGDVDGLNLSGLLIVSLAQPVHEGSYEAWQEVVLVPDTASPEQITALLKTFDGVLSSIPAEVVGQSRRLAPVYRAHMLYTTKGDEATLSLAFEAAKEHCIRLGTYETAPRSWHYDGPMAVRDTFDTQK